LLIALVLFSLVGIPPLSGFWPKIFLFQEAFTQEQYFYAAALILGSFVTLYVIANMWAQVFWKNAPEGTTTENLFAPMPPYRKILMVLPIGLMAVATLYIGLNAEAIVKIADGISTQLLDPTAYIEAVLGNKTDYNDKEFFNEPATLRNMGSAYRLTLLHELSTRVPAWFFYPLDHEPHRSRSTLFLPCSKNYRLCILFSL